MTTVAIVGAGPTGLTLANLLGLYGVSTVVVEQTKATDAVNFPRAVGLDHDALRTFQTIGLVGEMLPDIIQNSPAKFFNGNGTELVHIERQRFTETGWYRRNMFMQHLTDAVLLAGLDRFDEVDVRYETEVVGLRQDDNGVTLELRDSAGEPDELAAAFVVGADGARSKVRKLLGLRLEGETYEEPWLILEVSNDPWDRPYSGFFCDPSRPVYSGHLPRGWRRWGLLLKPEEQDEEVTSREGLRRLLSPMVPSFDELEIVNARVYRHQARVVPKMIKGRAALVGDAAHLMPPWAGQGLNSGLRDVTNLAWKLTAMHRYGCDRRLLDTFDAERRPHAQAVIDVSRRFGRIFLPRKKPNVLIRDGVLTTIKRLPILRERFYKAWFSTPFRYGEGGAIASSYGQRSDAVGTMFIQPRVATHEGQMRLDDAIGTWFTILSYRVDPAEQLSGEAMEFWKRLGARFVRVELASRGALEDSEPGTCLEDTEGRLSEWFAGQNADVVVLRPDRCVAAICNRDGLDSVTAEMATIIGHPRPVASVEDHYGTGEGSIRPPTLTTLPQEGTP